MADTLVEAGPLTLREAREMLDRALGMTRQLRLAGTFVIVDGGGHVVSISLMDGAPPNSILISRAKAYVSAMSHRPSADYAMTGHSRPEVFESFLRLYPEATFPGPGGMPIFKQGRVVGGIATGGGIGPFTAVAGGDPSMLLKDGKQANAQDLVISFALGIPYETQHGGRESATGQAAEPVRLPLPLDEARRLADKAIAKAEEKGVGCSLTIVDEYGVIVQQDRMDGGPAMYADLSEAKAITAVNFQRPTSAVAEQLQRNPVHFDTLNRIVKFKVMPEPGGLPIVRDGRIIGGIGVAGGGNAQGSEEIAVAALS